MYSGNLDEAEFWLGHVDERGKIVGFTDFIVDDVPSCGIDNDIFYLVQVTEDGESLDVDVVQWYKATDARNRDSKPINILTSEGVINPIEVSNAIISSVLNATYQ